MPAVMPADASRQKFLFSEIFQNEKFEIVQNTWKVQKTFLVKKSASPMPADASFGLCALRGAGARVAPPSGLACPLR